MAPQISIIMPCLNAERHIENAVASVLGQSFTDFELLIVDNGSTDHTTGIIGSFSDSRIRAMSFDKRGVGFARNYGLQHAYGEYVAFLDSDDTWSPEFIEKMHLALQARPDAVLAYCGWQNVGLKGPRSDPFVPPDYEGPNKFEALLEGCRWPIHGVLTRRSAITAAGDFNTDLTIAEDYLLWMEVSVAGAIVRVPEVLAQYHHHDGVQATHNLALAALDTLRAKQTFLNRHPEIARQLGSARVESLTWEKLIQQGNALHWKGDLINARPVFRKALLAGHGSLSAKLRMLPSLLPLKLHRAIQRSAAKYYG
jgi:glycosyltransferase involved in cell wall biosynthesis